MEHDKCSLAHRMSVEVLVSKPNKYFIDKNVNHVNNIIFGVFCRGEKGVGVVLPKVRSLSPKTKTKKLYLRFQF